MNLDHEQFFDFELDQSLYDLTVDGVPVWERIRVKVANEIKRKHGLGQAHSNAAEGYASYTKAARLLAKNIVHKNPLLADQSDIVIVGSPRRKQLEDGRWWDIYTDPIHQKLDTDSLHLELPYSLEHRSPVPTENMRYLDMVKFIGDAQRLLGVGKPTLTTKIDTRLNSISRAIKREFDATVNVGSITRETLHKRTTLLRLYKRVIERTRPSIVVLVCSYGKETLIEACKDQNIPVVELQHGVIYEHHYGYSFPAPRTKEMFPDYLLTFGEFWGEHIEFPIPDERVIPVGYPHLENSLDRYTDDETSDQFLFISQGTIGEQLSKFAMEVDRHPDVDYDIVYKLHPGEYDRWKDEYPWLLDANFEIVDSSDRQLYRLFAESSAQIGVGSTAVYEGLAFGLETFVYDCPGSDVLEPLIDEGAASMVTSVDELASALGGEGGSFDREYYFAPNATQQACNVIERLAENGTMYDRANEL
ncbi:hypothetical protein [Halovivax cerinus]|uniref:Capsule polysaccharide biosynthesis protein n=1 Tax=Halovivax cerinus TaxID=1487865 RepID=A0ABD5NQH2_9EURY|nr:hypothetical protein [Halovivax cerinus]